MLNRGESFNRSHNTGRFIFTLLRFRYRIRFQGIEQLKQIETPILFIFEHAARHDSFFHFAILSRLKSKITGKPLLPAYIAEGDVVTNPSIQKLFKSRWVALPTVFASPVSKIPEERKKQAEHLIDTAITHLKSGQNLALAPTGMLIRADGITVMKEKFGTSRILQAFNPGELTVVATKFEGLFGSVWSRALNGDLPTAPLVKKVIWSFLKGGLILSCRRTITVSFEICNLPMGSESSLENVNRTIERIFSKQHRGTFVPYNHINKKTLRELKLELQ